MKKTEVKDSHDRYANTDVVPAAKAEIEGESTRKDHSGEIEVSSPPPASKK